MSSNRGLANEALYRARIILDAWESALEAGSGNSAQVSGAFRPAAALHLQRAYGWCLLAVAGRDPQPDPEQLPRRAADVPAPPAGREVAPELREFELLEREGWLADMLAADGLATRESGDRGLLGSDRQPAGPGEFERWRGRLEATISRMDDLLAEC